MFALPLVSAGSLLVVTAFLAVLTKSSSPPTDRKVVIRLPPPDTMGRVPVEQALLGRRSVRSYSAKPLTLGAVSQLLWAAQGTTAAEGGRTAPSAGALYPLEIHLVATRVEGLPQGLYRYSSASHSLRQSASGDLAPLFARASGDQDFITNAAAVVLIAAVEERTAKKYGARSSRYVLLEAGAVSQNLALEAVALGLGSVVVGAFDDARLARLARLGEKERPLCLMPVGWPS